MGDRFYNELKQLHNLAGMLEANSGLRVSLSVKRLTLDFRSFGVNLSGLRSLVKKPPSVSQLQDAVSDSFNVLFSVPRDYPFSKPDIKFDRPIPFHPHIWRDGRICWGTLGDPRASQQDWITRMLVGWVGAIVEYLQYEEGTIRINSGSPANSEAMDWWRSHSKDIRKYVPAIDMAKFRKLIEEAKASVS